MLIGMVFGDNRRFHSTAAALSEECFGIGGSSADNQCKRALHFNVS
jgi:hypothetical protein